MKATFLLAALLATILQTNIFGVDGAIEMDVCSEDDGATCENNLLINAVTYLGLDNCPVNVKKIINDECLDKTSCSSAAIKGLLPTECCDAPIEFHYWCNIYNTECEHLVYRCKIPWYKDVESYDCQENKNYYQCLWDIKPSCNLKVPKGELERVEDILINKCPELIKPLKGSNVCVNDLESCPNGMVYSILSVNSGFCEHCGEKIYQFIYNVCELKQTCPRLEYEKQVKEECKQRRVWVKAECHPEGSFDLCHNNAESPSCEYGYVMSIEQTSCGSGNECGNDTKEAILKHCGSGQQTCELLDFKDQLDCDQSVWLKYTCVSKRGECQKQKDECIADKYALMGKNGYCQDFLGLHQCHWNALACEMNKINSDMERTKKYLMKKSEDKERYPDSTKGVNICFSDIPSCETKEHPIAIEGSIYCRFYKDCGKYIQDKIISFCTGKRNCSSQEIKAQFPLGENNNQFYKECYEKSGVWVLPSCTHSG